MYPGPLSDSLPLVFMFKPLVCTSGRDAVWLKD